MLLSLPLFLLYFFYKLQTILVTELFSYLSLSMITLHGFEGATWPRSLTHSLSRSPYCREGDF
jgi:hypothetical protein